MIISINRNGQVTAVAHDNDMEALQRTIGKISQRRRGGHVVPANRLCRWAFQVIRKSPSKRLAAWTRSWPIQWVADLAVSNGPMLGPFDRRPDAIAAEERWLADHLTSLEE